MPTRVPLSPDPAPFVPDGSWYFVTLCCTPRRLNQLCTANVGRALLADAVFYHTQCTWTLHLLLLMPDHCHAIVGAGSGGRLADVIRDWKRLTARRHLIRWQRDFFDHRLRAGENLEAKARYIRENPVRAGLVRDAAEWPYFVDFITLDRGCRR